MGHFPSSLDQVIILISSLRRYPDWALLHDAARSRAWSNSHSVAALDGCTIIPLAADLGSGDETILDERHLSQPAMRFVDLDPSGL